jgi:hypothetical protein
MNPIIQWVEDNIKSKSLVVMTGINQLLVTVKAG